MSFSKVYSDLLLPFVENYKLAKNEKNRGQVVKNAADAVSSSSQLLEDQGVNLPKDLKSVCPCSFSILLYYYSLVQAITRYIKAFIKKETTVEGEDPKPMKLKQVYTIRDVVKQQYRAEIEEEIPYQHGEKEYIGSYQNAVTKVLNNLSKKDVKEAEKMVELWNTQGPPSNVQLK